MKHLSKATFIHAIIYTLTMSAELHAQSRVQNCGQAASKESIQVEHVRCALVPVGALDNYSRTCGDCPRQLPTLSFRLFICACVTLFMVVAAATVTVTTPAPAFADFSESFVLSLLFLSFPFARLRSKGKTARTRGFVLCCCCCS